MREKQVDKIHHNKKESLKERELKKRRITNKGDHFT